MSATGTAYLVDGAGKPHWIPDGHTYQCYVARGIAVVDGLVQQHVDSIGNGQPWADRCLDANQVRNKIIVVGATQTAYLVDGSGRLRWIPNGNVWNCLVARHPVIRGFTQQHADSLGNGQPWASC